MLRVGNPHEASALTTTFFFRSTCGWYEKLIQLLAIDA